ncbi:MAG: NAD(P)-dependent oxidoreductase [Bacteriovorax sp.]|nr:NAD(P)-dependent oxidoreductase [Bacteriovorax sp.]
MKILVTGASGFVGTHLCERLLKEGHDVFALVRTPKRFELKNNKLTVIQGDLDQPILHWVNGLPSDLDTCLHSAGLVHSYLEKEFFRVNAEGTGNLVNGLRTKFEKLHFVLVSSLAAAGPSLGSEKRTEMDIDFPVSMYGRSKKEAENILKKDAPSLWTQAIVRPPMVIGPRDSAVLDIFKMVQSGLVILPGKGSKEKCYSFVCVHDLVETLVLVCEKRKSSLFYSSNPQATTFDQLIKEIKKQLKKKWIFYIPLPLIFIRILTSILYFIYRLRPHPLRLTPDKYYELKAVNWTCSGKKSEEELGQVYNYDLERTIKVTLNDYKSRSWI